MPHSFRRSSEVLLAATLVVIAICALASSASASPTALKFIFVDAQCQAAQPPNIFKDQMLASPGVASVDIVQASTSGGGAGITPTAAQLSQYDAAIVASDCEFADATGVGDALADFQDAGGVVVVAASWTLDHSYDGGFIAGRWFTGGYWPATSTNGPGGNPTFVPLDPASPVFEGVGPLTAEYTQSLTPNTGAQVLANWSDGNPAVVVKGRAATINEMFGDYNIERIGNFGRLAVNLTKLIGKQPVTVTKSGNGVGTVTGTVGGLNCGVLCSVFADNGTPVQLSATASKGSTFTGWSGSCVGKATCAATLAYPGLSVTAGFASTKIRFGKFKKRVLSVKLPGAGKLVVSGSGVKKVTKSAKKASTLKIKLKPTGKLIKKLKKGKAKAKLKLVYTPTGGGSATTKKTVTLK